METIKMAEHPELSAQERAGKAFPVSWDQFHRDCRALTWRLNEVGPFHAVIAITRGGLVPAAIVARELGVRVIDTVCITSYAHTTQGNLQAVQPRLMITIRRKRLGDVTVDALQFDPYRRFPGLSRQSVQIPNFAHEGPSFP